jgi:hypothetical protein
MRLLLGIVEKESLYVKLREMSEYFYGDEGKGGIWGPGMMLYDSNKTPSMPSAQEILRDFGLPINHFGWERVLEQNYLSSPSEDEQDERLGLNNNDDDDLENLLGSLGFELE